MRKLSKKSVAVATTALVLVGGGAAYAYWTTTGSGTGTAAAGADANAVTVNQTSLVTGLVPGGAPVALSGNFDNANSGSVHVASVSATVVDTTNSGCTAADFAIAGTSTVSAEIPPGTGTGSWSGLTVRMLDRTGVNQDACKGVTVHLSYATS